MELAPIVLFVYNRAEHTRQTLEALSQNLLADQSTLFIYADGAKENSEQFLLNDIQEVRRVIREKKWCHQVQIIESSVNKGLANSVIDGVTDMVNKYGKIIVLEDDLVPSPHFLSFMNEGLNLYKNMSNVYSVNAYMFPIDSEKSESVLLPYTSTWGWGTWKDKWDVFNYEMSQKDVINGNLFLTKRFNLADYPYISMLNGMNNSWGIRWYYSVFIRNGLGVFPTKSLVYNTGFDGSGVHHTEKTIVNQSQTLEPIHVILENTINLDFYARYLNHFRKKKKSTMKKIILSLAKKTIKK